MRKLPTLFENVQSMHDEMNRFFDELSFPSNLISTDENYYRPRADMWEENGELVAEFEIPGIKKEDVDVKLNDDTVEITAKRNFEDNNRKGYFERSYSGFYRSFTLPQNVLGNEAKASFENGVLTLRIPKKERVDTSKKIEIE